MKRTSKGKALSEECGEILAYMEECKDPVDSHKMTEDLGFETRFGLHRLHDTGVVKHYDRNGYKGAYRYVLK